MSINMLGLTMGGRGLVGERVNANSSCFRVKIPNFTTIEKSAHLSILGPPMKAIGSMIDWRLQVYPNGRNVKKVNEYITVALDYYTMVDDVTATFELSIVDIDNEIIEALKVKEVVKLVIDREAQYPRYITVGFYCLKVRRSEVENSKNRMLKDNCLTLSLDITYTDPMVVSSIANKNENLMEERLKEFDDFGKLLESGKYSDVKFVVGDKEIHVHKAILASRSPVFDAMFQQEMEEKEKNTVKMIDIEYEVLMELFRFIYTGAVSNIDQVACDLLIAADKYCIERLKPLCEKTLMGDLKIDNVIQRFATADVCNATCLKKRAFELILNHADEIVDRDEFSSLNPILMREILRAVIPKKNK